MKASRIFETILYAKDLEAAETFYRDVIGLQCIRRGESAAVLRCGEGFLLIFDPDVARSTARGVPAHGTTGAGHIAFAVPGAELDAWRIHLGRKGIPIEMEVTWPEGGTSIYMRDPAGNSVELAPPSLWIASSPATGS